MAINTEGAEQSTVAQENLDNPVTMPDIRSSQRRPLLHGLRKKIVAAAAAISLFNLI